MEIEPTRPQEKRGGPRFCHQLKNATTGFIFYAFVVAFTMQTSVVVYYIEENLKHHYGVNVCEVEEEEHHSHSNTTESDHHSNTTELDLDHPDNKTETGHHNTKMDHDPYEECEEKFKEWNMYLFFVYAIPAFILAPLVGNWSDSLHRVIPMYVVQIGILISTLATGVAMQLKSSLTIVTFCTYPTCFTGGMILITLIIFSYEAERRHGFEIFERFLELTAIYVTATTTNQGILTIFDQYVPNGLSNPAAYWIPLVFAIMAFIRLMIKRKKIVDTREMNVKFSRICRQILPIDFNHLFKCPLFIHIFFLFVCAFMYYFDYVSETLEAVNIATKHESWQVSSFSIQGALQGAAESLGLLFLLYFLKRVVHKHIVDKKLLPKVPLSYLGILALFLDFLTKLVVSLVPPNVSYATLWVPILGIICELTMAVIRFFAVLIVPKSDAGKSLSLLSWAQLIAIVPGPLMIKSVSEWCHSFWPSFVYLFMGLLLIIPAVLLWIVGKFGHLPDLIHDVHPEEEEEKPKKGPPFGKRFQKIQHNHNVEIATVT